MIDQWFSQDVEKALKDKKRLVFIDEGGQADFLRKVIPASYRLLEAHDEIEELHVKYQVEKSHREEQVIFYTHTPMDRLKYLREYCETGGNIEIRYLQHYIKEKLYQHLELNLNLDKEELIAAAKNSIGKDHTYWMKLGKGLGDIFDLEKDLLPFLHAPKKCLKAMDEDVQEIFLRKVNHLTGQAYVTKPPETLAKEVVHQLFDGLLNNKPDKLLLHVYHQWLDSRSYESSFKQYLDAYPVPSVGDPWAVHPDHPFRQVDEAALEALSKQLHNKGYIGSILPKINQRAVNRYVRQMCITFWQSVKTLLDFDAQGMNQLHSLEETVAFYTGHFWQVDRAIRHLYTAYLGKEHILRPFQEYYENLNSILLEKWFRFLQPYRQNQTGLLERLIRDNGPKTAIIVGDGVAYEIAKGVAAALESDFKISTDITLSDYPSETENNMSQLYQSNGEVVAIHGKREEYLAAHCGKSVQFVHLDNVNETTDGADYLVCTYKDIDELGEKMQQRALKLFATIEEVLVQKIGILLRSGYCKVFLVADHGFVLTGLLAEADKIEVNFQGKVSKSERYVRTAEKQQAGDSFVEMEKPYKEFRYLYFSKNTRPFKTPGVYGYSHGGLTPQELITPCFCFENAQIQEKQLSVQITNKPDLKQVTGALFALKMKAEQGDGSLFAAQRKCYLLFFSEGKEFNKSEVFTIKSGESLEKEFTFDKHDAVEVVLLDAVSKAQIDKATVNKDDARDLGGLL